jgi:hypothetical protein
MVKIHALKRPGKMMIRPGKNLEKALNFIMPGL